MSESDAEQKQKQKREELAIALPKLTPEQLADVSPHFVREHYAPGEVILHQGDAADRFYILISGQAEIWHEDLEGVYHLVRKSEPGEYFGETGLLQHHPRSATVRVSSDTAAEVLALEGRYFQEMIEESKATEAQVAREMIQRLINLSEYQS